MTRKKTDEDNVALYFFNQGKNIKSYEYLGSHKAEGEKNLYSFRVWAPHAKSVSIRPDEKAQRRRRLGGLCFRRQRL